MFLNEVKPAHILSASGPRTTEQPADDSDALNDLFESITKANVYQEPSCKVYTTDEVFRYNFLFWASAFTIGINFTHADVKAMQWLTLDPTVIATWGKKQWAFVAVLGALLASFLFNLAQIYIEVQVLSRYVIWAGVLYGAIKWNTVRLKDTRVLHIHHYFLAMVLMSFISGQSPLFTVMHGFFHGMMIEGGCRWGFDPMWVPLDEYAQKYGSKRDLYLLNVKRASIRKLNYEQSKPTHVQPSIDKISPQV